MTKKNVFTVTLSIIFTGFLFCICFYLINNVQDQLPNVTQLNYNFKSGYNSLDIGDIEDLYERIYFRRVSFCSEQGQRIIKEETVIPVLINEYYFEIYEIKLNGNGFTEENIKNKDKVAVIGSTLALKLFFNTDAVGKTITIDNQEYKICGVIDEDENIINQISSDGKQRVYIPYTCYPQYENCSVDMISYDNSVSSAPLIEQMDLSEYHSTNFSDKSKAIENFKHILFLLLFVTLCVIALKVWYVLCKRLYSDIKEDLKENYLLKSLKSIPIKFILLIIISVSIPALLLIIFLILDFSIYIIPEYIPYDNIFDFSYYIKMIIENKNLLNSLAITGNTYLINLYTNSFSTIIWIVVIFIIVFLVTLSKIFRFIKKSESPYL